MVVMVYFNSSAENVVKKNISYVGEIDCKVTDDISIANPRLLISEGNLYNKKINYAKLFGRYYFIDSVIKTNNKMVEVTLREDYLSTLFNYVDITGTIVKSAYSYNSDLNQRIPVQVNKQIRRVVFDENKAEIEGRIIVAQTPLPVRVLDS